MTSAIDSNVLISLWDKDDALSAMAERALESALQRGALVVAAPVFAELLASPGRSTSFLDSFFKDTGISVDWDFGESIWRAAGLAFQSYAARRRRHGESGPRRILADFLIGAHAMQSGYGLLTLDDRLYRLAFPGLRILSV